MFEGDKILKINYNQVGTYLPTSVKTQVNRIGDLYRGETGVAHKRKQQQEGWVNLNWNDQNLHSTLSVEK